ncbi:ShlB/FhaC/HecB family hemolysin secretion/activation protein [Inhella gelatinilytica]|uniref:ShlB/FhaC/HecB family hemolysin secretion/activation protein n=1 Tax=Inhella gelatinilytica TaxID=2795030 RepID=A0A931IYR3_9BURK|nr:ShlB/FhaC/HecB family hemolysin secretion/activation protein [Inhella gelatinilytica]MBH9554066.1 ShlB/FhaC/HecB family hemolysin secretion/activation protein [Inhella gelatinilytica]
MRKCTWAPWGWALIGVMAASQVAAQSAPVVKGFKINGNSLLEPAVIEAVLVAHKGERTNQQLRVAAQAVQAAYREAGYGAVLVSVFAPGSDGIAEVRVLEGKVGRVVAVGAEQFSADSVRQALPALAEGQTPRVVEIDRQVELANQNPARKLAVTLEPGQRIGSVDAQIGVTESPVLQGQAALDNTGSEQSGRTRVSAGLRHANVAGWGHQFTGMLQTSVERPSRVAIVSGNYVLPLPSPAQRLDFYAMRSNVDGGNTATAAGALTFNGRGHVLGAQWTQLLLRRGDWGHRLRAGLETREYRNRCAIEGLPEGACGPAGESVTVHPLSVEYSAQGGRDPAWEGHISAVQNLGLGGRFGSAAHFDAVRAGAVKSYRVLRLGGQVQWRLPAQWQLSARALGQWSPHALISGEQFGPAGANSVRGYREREVLGDNGWLASAELRSPVWTWSTLGDTQLQAVVFTDWGQAKNHGDLECRAGQTTCNVGSVGLGLRASRGRWRLIADVAHALRSGTQTESGSNRIHVAASYGLE